LHLDTEIDVADVPPFVAKSLSCLYENNDALPYAARSCVVPKCQSAAMKNRTVVTAELPEGAKFGMLRHMISSPLHIVIMVALMAAIMAAAMMMMR
jgi:hypothetical protein